MFQKTLNEGIAGDNVGLLLRGIQRTEIERLDEQMVSFADQALSLVDEVLSITQGGDSIVDGADLAARRRNEDSPHRFRFAFVVEHPP